MNRFGKKISINCGLRFILVYESLNDRWIRVVSLFILLPNRTQSRCPSYLIPLALRNNRDLKHRQNSSKSLGVGEGQCSKIFPPPSRVERLACMEFPASCSQLFFKRACCPDDFPDVNYPSPIALLQPFYFTVVHGS